MLTKAPAVRDIQFVNSKVAAHREMSANIVSHASRPTGSNGLIIDFPNNVLVKSLSQRDLTNNNALSSHSDFQFFDMFVFRISGSVTTELFPLRARILPLLSLPLLSDIKNVFELLI